MDIDADFTEKKLSRTSTSTILWIGMYGLAIIAVEAVVGFFDPILGAALDAVLLFVLLNNFFFSKGTDDQIYLVLALLPLLRILSLVVPVVQVPQIYWYAMVGIPVLLAAGLVMRWLNPAG